MTEPSEYVPPADYEAEEWSRPDEMALYILLWESAQTFLDERPDALVLDACCGTGMSLLGFAAHPNITAALGVEIDLRASQFAGARFAEYPAVDIAHHDIFDLAGSHRRFDLIIISSAFHHIQPDRQDAFATLLRALVKDNGRVIAAENMVPAYVSRTDPSYHEAVDRYYGAVLASAVERRPQLPETIRQMILENARMAHRGIFEYKLHLRDFVSRMEKAGFEPSNIVRVWPGRDGLLDDGAGNYLIEFNPLS